MSDDEYHWDERDLDLEWLSKLFERMEHREENPEAAQPEITPDPIDGNDLSEAMRTVTLESKDLASIISQNACNNYGKVVGLKYYAGGRDLSDKYPTLSFTRSLNEWIADLDSRTADNWTDIGRIQIAKQYAVEAAYELIKAAAEQTKDNWGEVKALLRQTFPEALDFFDRKMELTSIRRKTGETLSEFWARLEILRHLLVKMKPEFEIYLNYDKVLSFLTAMPVDFRSWIPEDDFGDGRNVFTQAMRYGKSHPQCKLTAAETSRETKQPVAVVSNSGNGEGYQENKTYSGGARPKTNWQRPNIPATNFMRGARPMTTQRPAYSPHPPPFQPRWSANQPRFSSPRGYVEVTCYHCGRRGHFEKNCREKTAYCNYCNRPGHYAIHCRNIPPNGQYHNRHNWGISGESLKKNANIRSRN